MKKPNPPVLRTNCVFFLARIVFLITVVAVTSFVVTRSGFTSKAPNVATVAPFCTADPVVANNLDSGAGSFRQAIIDACDGSTITFNMATVTSPISLTTDELLINKNLTITGPGATTLTIERNAAPATPQFRIFRITSVTGNISGLTLTNGRAPDGPPPAGTIGTNGGEGGAIRIASSTVTLSDVRVTGNRAGNGSNSSVLPGKGGGGGGIYIDTGSLTMTNCTVSGNTGGSGGFSGTGLGGGQGGDGGGIYSQNATLNLTSVSITNNMGGQSSEISSFAGIGGGLFTNTTTVATLTSCNVSGNMAGLSTGSNGSNGYAGGIDSGGPITIISSTISGNTSANSGGGILSRSGGSIINSTISGNNAASGDGVYKDTAGSMSLVNCTITNNSGEGITGPNVSVRNTIIAGNAGLDAVGSFNSLGNNLIGSNAFNSGFINGINGDQVGTEQFPVNADLGPLANNGGPTQTHALLAHSPALDAGNNCVVDNTCSPAVGFSLTTDQRGAGFARALDSGDANTTATVDIGAFEAQASVENISDKVTAEETLLSFSFNVGAGAGTVSASSANTVLVPNNPGNINVTGSGSTRTLNITPATNQTGTSTITVTVTSGAESVSDTFVLTVTNVNDGPTDIALSNNTVADNSPSNTLVGTLSSTDPDASDTFTYTLVTGTGAVDNASFSISGNELRTASVFDFETKSSYSIRVRSTDSGSLFVEKQFTINVINGLDNPGAISFSSANFSVGEGDGNANITLTRTGGADNRVVAKVNLADVTTSPADYIFAPGSLDSSFNAGTGATSGSPALPQFVQPVVLQPDGKILIGGAFLFYNDVPRNRIARINSDGSLDSSFTPGAGANNFVLCMALQPDGKILIGGQFTSYDGTSRFRIARLNTDGTLDPTFAAVPDDVVSAIAVQPDGKILIGGAFFIVNGVSRNRVARLNHDGSVDFSFNPGLGSNAAVTTLALQPDGKIIVGGGFTSFATATNTRIVRLDSTGAVDATFNSALGLSLAPRQALLQSDGKILVAGEWVGTDTPFGKQGIARLETNGAADATFNPGIGTDGHPIQAFALQPDSKIIIVGAFPTFNGTTVNGVARLNSGGSLDSSFNSGQGVNVPFPARGVAVQSDGKIVMGGQYSFYNGVVSNGITRINGDLFVTWAPGDSANKSVSLPIVDDTQDEPAETLSLQVVPISGGATTGTHASSVLTINDNDKVSSTTVLSSSANPSEFGQSVTFTATVTGSGGTPTGTVQFKDGGSNLGSPQTLTAGVAQLTTSSLASGTHTITAEYSGDANFFPSSGTLSGGQVVKNQPTLTINDVSIAEGNSGTTNLVFTVTLSAASALTVNVDFATADGTATTSDNDYQSINGTVIFNPGELTKTITVVVNGDQKTELNETVLVNLTNPVNAAVTDAQGVGTIQNDDTLQLILDESGPAVDQAAALESWLSLRDPFRVLSIAGWLDLGPDRNTRVMIFAANLTLNQGELPSSVVVNLVDGNNQTHNVPAEDVRAATQPGFTQVVFRLPDTLAPGVCQVTIKAQGRTSNTGTFRIVQ